MNKVILIGNLSKEPEMLTTTNGVSASKFTIAVQRKYTNQDGEREADFLPCVAWRKTAENLCNYCSKGDKIAVVGTIQTRSYEVPDGTKRYVTEIVADEIEFLKTKGTAGNETAEPEFAPIDDDNLPF